MVSWPFNHDTWNCCTQKDSLYIETRFKSRWSYLPPSVPHSCPPCPHLQTRPSCYWVMAEDGPSGTASGSVRGPACWYVTTVGGCWAAAAEEAIECRRLPPGHNPASAWFVARLLRRQRLPHVQWFTFQMSLLWYPWNCNKNDKMINSWKYFQRCHTFVPLWYCPRNNPFPQWRMFVTGWYSVELPLIWTTGSSACVIGNIITWLCDILALVWHFGPACVTFRPGLCDILALSCVTKASACHHTPILTTGAVYRKFHRSSVS